MLLDPRNQEPNTHTGNSEAVSFVNVTSHCVSGSAQIVDYKSQEHSRLFSSSNVDWSFVLSNKSDRISIKEAVCFHPSRPLTAAVEMRPRRSSRQLRVKPIMLLFHPLFCFLQAAMSSQDEDPMSKLIEQETEGYYKADPDPFDDRHPGRADPNCMLGQLLKMLFLNDDFTNALLDTYIMTNRDVTLNTAACRLLLNIVPGLDTAVVFEDKVFCCLKLQDGALFIFSSIMLII
ncbi:hypothetical protein XENOCAPTIV_001827 [Xenoophorus captivus]|uniref:Uncharacterized protein n=1 Tax=Xenoophorus captivus TaxID=1517983 RepID=A0ABV0S9R9_9TELE